MLGFKRLDLRDMIDYYLQLTLAFCLIVVAYLGPLIVGSICLWKAIAIGDCQLFIWGFLLVVIDILFWIDSVLGNKNLIIRS